MHLGVFTLECIKKQLFVIAPEANDLVGRPFLEIHQEIDDAPAVGATVDVVSEEDEDRLVGRGVLLAEPDEPLELFSAAMDISDGVRFGQKIGLHWSDAVVAALGG